MSLDWNSKISRTAIENSKNNNSGNERVLLPEGNYNFKVTYYEKSRNRANNPMAIIHLDVEGKAEILDYISIQENAIWKMDQFFAGIGINEEDEELINSFDKAVGKTGKLHLKQEKRNGKNGGTYYVNSVAYYLDPLVKDDFLGVTDSSDNLSLSSDDEVPF